MARSSNRFQARKNRARVREVLMREWDPIGISGVPEAVDEYDTYADKAYAMLMVERASAEAISAYLFDVATSHMGISSLGTLAERSDRTAKVLVAMRPEFETH
jgi:hypothetical protein